MRKDWREAALANNVGALGRLLADGVRVDCRDVYGQTALMLAAHRGNSEAVALLLERGADMNITAKYGLSALMLAVINRQGEAARLLIEAGADATIRGSGAPGFAGKSARDLAIELGLADLVSVFDRLAR